MNCTDFSRILDGCTLADLPEREAISFRAHISDCSGCASQHAADSGIATFRADVPVLPDSLQARARQLQEQFDGKAEQRPTRRPILIGSLLLLGAAATMFTAIPREEDTATA
jgi:hypothetical protein